MNRSQVKEKYNLTDSDLIEIITSLIVIELPKVKVKPKRKDVVYNSFDSLKSSISTMSEKGVSSTSVRRVRDTIKNKVAFSEVENLTSFIRGSLADLEGTGLIYDIDGDNFKIKPFTTKNN